MLLDHSHYADFIAQTEGLEKFTCGRESLRDFESHYVSCRYIISTIAKNINNCNSKISTQIYVLS